MVTVLLPVRNGAPFLGRALRSPARRREVLRRRLQAEGWREEGNFLAVA